MIRYSAESRGSWCQRRRLTKRVFDVALVLAALPLLMPIFAGAVIAIKLESPRDPVFYVQKRTGRDGRRFRMYKFRSMHVDAEKILGGLQHLNTRQGGDIKIPNDPRITKVGRWLRATNIDELPQLLNVLQGDMSLVGPRPTSYGPERFSVWHSERFGELPGITGLWQLYQDSVSHLDDKIRLDIAYVQRQCLWLDVELLLRTALIVFMPPKPKSPPPYRDHRGE